MARLIETKTLFDKAREWFERERIMNALAVARVQDGDRALATTQQKGLYDLHPELLGREYVGRWSGYDPSPSGGLYNYKNAIQDFNSYVWVHKAVSYIADSIANVDIDVWRDDQMIDSHPLTDLFETVNDTMTSSDLWRWWAVDMMLAGESGFELVRQGRGYAEVWPRQPNTIIINPDGSGRYRRVASYTIDDQMGEPYTVPADEFMFFKTYNPASPWRGISRIAAVRAGIRIDKAAQAWSSEFYGRGARPDYAIMTPAGTTRSEREQYKAEVTAQTRGTANEPIVLEEGITDIKTLSFPPKDMTWLDHRNMSRDEVAAVFGLPDIIMGFGNDSYDTEDKRKVAERAAWTMTLKPLTMFRDTSMTEFFRRAGLLKPNEEIKSDLTDIDALQEQAQIFQYHIEGGMVTRNEVRASLGLPPEQEDAEGQRFYVLGQKLSLMTTAVNAGYDPVTAAEIVGMDTLPVIDLPPEPPTPDTTPPQSPAPAPSSEYQPTPPPAPATPEPAKQLAITQPHVKAVRALRKGQKVLFGSDEHKVIYDEYVKAVDPHERRFGAVTARSMNRQREEVQRRVASDAAAAAESPFSKPAWEKRFGNAVAPVIKDTVKAFGNQALDDVNVSLRFDLLDPNVVDFMKERKQRFAEEVNATTWDKLKATLTDGIEKGETIDELAARVDDTMDVRVGQSAEAIARTEVIGASSGGTIEGYRQSGVVDKKVWISTLDDRVRETHADMHGEEADLDADFDVGDCSGPGPGQIDCASETVNCRCVLIAGLSED